MSTEKNSSVDSEDDEEELDPRVKLELERLNVAADGVNHLETEYGEAQTLFNQMLADAGMQLRLLKQKLGKTVERARPYYDTLAKARQAKTALHFAAMDFENAQSRHDLARKKVSEAESRAFSGDGKINSAMQEMLNQANLEVMEAARRKGECWKAHQLTAQVFEEEQKKLTDLSKSLHKVITKSRPYFELKMNYNTQLEEQRQRIENIHAGVKVAKKEYGNTLSKLEKISNEIHHLRRMRKLNQTFPTPRGQGVGAESTSEDECSSSSGGVFRTKSGTDIRIKDFDEVSAFGDDTESLADSEKDHDNRRSPSEASADVAFDFGKDQANVNAKGKLLSLEYDLISSKEVKMSPPVTDFLSDDILFQSSTKLHPGISKRWKSLNSIEGNQESHDKVSIKDALGRTSSLSFSFLPNLWGRVREPQNTNPTVADSDVTTEYDIIDGKRVAVDRNSNRVAQSAHEEPRHPGEGCDSALSLNSVDPNPVDVQSDKVAISGGTEIQSTGEVENSDSLVET